MDKQNILVSSIKERKMEREGLIGKMVVFMKAIS